MKFRVMMKSPDAVYESIEEAVKDSIAELNLPDDESDELLEVRREKVTEQCSKWFEYSEYLTVEVDTDAMTCVVVPVK